jgi:hypothetical protein
MKHQITPTAAPVPQVLPAAFGYEGDARYFAAYWLSGGDELMLADGQIEFTAANWHAFLLYRDHPSVAPHLARYNFGSSDDEAEHWLVIDCIEHRAHVAPVAEARAFLRAQWPEAEASEDAPDLTAEEFMAQFKAAITDWQETHATVNIADTRAQHALGAGIRAQLETQATLCQKLQAELNEAMRVAQQ